ncbi:hypothetical protein Tco_0074197 [Tanacetum coccineum]
MGVLPGGAATYCALHFMTYTSLFVSGYQKNYIIADKVVYIFTRRHVISSEDLFRGGCRKLLELMVHVLQMPAGNRGTHRAIDIMRLALHLLYRHTSHPFTHTLSPATYRVSYWLRGEYNTIQFIHYFSNRDAPHSTVSHLPAHLLSSELGGEAGTAGGFLTIAQRVRSQFYKYCGYYQRGFETDTTRREIMADCRGGQKDRVGAFADLAIEDIEERRGLLNVPREPTNMALASGVL